SIVHDLLSRLQACRPFQRKKMRFVEANSLVLPSFRRELKPASLHLPLPFPRHRKLGFRLNILRKSVGHSSTRSTPSSMASFISLSPTIRLWNQIRIPATPSRRNSSAEGFASMSI